MEALKKTSMPAFKFCRWCEQWKLTSDFYLCSSGYLYYCCKSCWKEKVKKQRKTERGRVARRRYKQSGKGKACDLRYRLSGKKAKKDKRYYQKHREERLLHQKLYYRRMYLENPEWGEKKRKYSKDVEEKRRETGYYQKRGDQIKELTGYRDPRTVYPAYRLLKALETAPVVKDKGGNRNEA